MSSDLGNRATIPAPRPPWYAPTTAKFLMLVLLLQGFLVVSARYRWFWFNEQKGFAVLVAVAVTAVLLLLLGVVIVASRFFKAKMQFGLSTLLLMVPVIAIPCSWLARELELARQQRACIESILAHGGRVYYHRWPDILPDSAYEWLAPALGSNFFLDVSEVWAPQAKDLDLGMVGRFNRLLALDLRQSSVTDDDLALLRELKRLEWLYLDETAITDAGLEHVQELSELQRLYLISTGVTDRGLARLSKLEHLQLLYLDRTQVTDAGLVHLVGISNLTSLRLYETQVTQEGVERLKQALPRCLIHR